MKPKKTSQPIHCEVCGTTYRVGSKEEKKHERECENTLIDCPFHGFNCGVTIPDLSQIVINCSKFQRKDLERHILRHKKRISEIRITIKKYEELMKFIKDSRISVLSQALKDLEVLSEYVNRYLAFLDSQSQRDYWISVEVAEKALESDGSISPRYESVKV